MKLKRCTSFLARRRLTVCLPPLLLVAAAAAANENDQACREVALQDESASFRFEQSPAHDEFAREVPPGARIGSIRQQRFTVFDTEDPEEDKALFRWANDFHSVTRDWVIEDHLLVKEGEEYNQARVDESERILRDLGFIYDATVRPWRVCGDVVDLEVITRDIWTFTPMLSFGRSGGENKYAVGFRDANFLGTGKQIIIQHDSDEERSGNTIRYVDPALAGSRWRMRLSLADNDDGYEHGVRFVRPFFSVYESWAAGVDLNRMKLEEALWFRGDEVAEFDHKIEFANVFGGIAANVRKDKRVGRWLFGYTLETHSFDFSDSPIPPAELPEEREYSYPYIGYESTRDQFIELHNVNYLGRTEDVYVGERFSWALGWSSDALGASQDQVVVRGNYGNTLLVDERRLWQLDTNLSGFWGVDGSEFENLWWTTETRYHHKQSRQWALFSRFRADYTDGLTGERQLTLGGANGLRGYELNYQVGDRSLVFNLEQRYYSDWHLFRLVQIGLAAFIDVGRAWFESEDNGSNGGVLANVGFGIRLNSSRAEKGSVVHVDFAFPFVTDDDVSGGQILFTVKDRF
ncbi:BamA/TamA family outer membrane protein [Haliea sp. E1-2-M8]|uniref:BamA/TamA family outer membrane protein n=1 Tax=Haliea sp. E1-2-M8 TaxID=3064706 RepID=UPI0027207619|nr:BamA/TamA family outer membrane protein [Haliea sp. E1-2-M8]MDO8861774.1 BamA/TamA family outer membrane protein [Haliea sp. E1-2-M8]